MILHNMLKSISLNGGHHYTSNGSQSLSGIGERTAEEFYSNSYSITFTIAAQYPDRQRSCGGNQCPNSTPLPKSDAFVHQGYLVLPDVQYHSSEKKPVAIMFAFFRVCDVNMFNWVINQNEFYGSLSCSL